MYVLALFLIIFVFCMAITALLFAISGSVLGLLIFIVILLFGSVYVIADYIHYVRIQKRMEHEKQEVFAQFKTQGFKSTHQYKISGQLFAIDTNSRQWFVMRYADPKNTQLHRFKDIRSYERRENTQTASIGTGLAGNSIGLASFVSQKLYTKLGVVVFLNDIKHPTEFISCMGNEDGVDEVLNILDIIRNR